MARPVTLTYQCHNVTCKLLDEQQDFKWLPTTWDAPGEWVTEPYCRECDSWIGEPINQHPYGPDDSPYPEVVE